jgi:hypothetical protein
MDRRAFGGGMDSILPNATWLARFASRLLQLKPELSALEAVRIAERQHAKVAHLDPAKAAEIYAKESAADE